MRKLFVRLAGIGLLGLASSAAATHFIIAIDPATGLMTMLVSAGRVEASPTDEPPSTIVPPSQQVVINPDPDLLAAGIAYMDPQDLSSMDAEVLTALLQNRPLIDAGNGDQFAASSQSPGTPDLTEQESLERYRQNVVYALEALLNNAVASGALTQEDIANIIATANREISNASRSYDLSREAPPIDRAAGVDEQREQEREQQRRIAEQRRQQQDQQEDRRQQVQQNNQELLNQLEARRREQEDANRRAADEKNREAEERMKQRLSDAERERLEQRMRDRAVGGNDRQSDLDPRALATPDSHRNHMNNLAGLGDGSDPGLAGGGPGSDAGDNGAADAGESGLDDVHTDFANQSEQEEAIAEAAEEYLASDSDPDPDLDPTPDPVDPWTSFLANSDGPLTTQYPSESIYGEAVGVYNGLVRGEFENGVSANGVMQMNIYFSDFHGDGTIRFDDDQGLMQFEGDVGGPGFEIHMEGEAFGGSANGHVYGRMYGPRGEEIGGTWGLNVYEGEFANQHASGNFAAQQ